MSQCSPHWHYAGQKGMAAWLSLAVVAEHAACTEELKVTSSQRWEQCTHDGGDSEPHA